MAQYQSVLVGLFVTVLGCGNTALTAPVTVNTGLAMPNDGYEAALATAEANYYSVVVKDPNHSFLRVQTRSMSGQSSKESVTFDIKAWKGFVDVLVKVPQGLMLADSQIHDLHGERYELAWAISKRARALAGEPFGDVDGNYWPAPLTMPSRAIIITIDPGGPAGPPIP